MKGNISSFDFVAYLLLNEEIDTIMHFAAQARPSKRRFMLLQLMLACVQTHVDNSFGNSFEFTKNNIVGTHVLLETARVAGTIKRFVHVSTDEVYGEASHENKEASFEFATLEPTNPYSASKAGAEMLVKVRVLQTCLTNRFRAQLLVVQAYFTSYKLPCIISRGNNVYGPHQYPEKLIPKFTLLAKKGMKLPVHGDGSALRSYLYVSDVAAAFEVLLHRGKVGEIYNIGTTKELSTLDVARDVCAALHLDANGLVQNVQDRLFNDRRYFIESTKLQELGWTPEVPWNVGLKKTIDWYVDNVFGKDYWADYEHALVAHPHALGAAQLDMQA